MSAKLLFTILCDDVREEKSEKLTLIGLYNYAIVFQAPPPNTAGITLPIKYALPQLCVVRRWIVDTPGLASVTELIDPQGVMQATTELPLLVGQHGDYSNQVLRLFGVVLVPGVYTIRTRCSGSEYVDRFEVRTVGAGQSSA
jgi:hypothetical protein